MQSSRTRCIASLLLSLLGLAAQAQSTDDVVAWRVQPRDTLIGIARSSLVSDDAWREVARLNRLPNPNRLRPGQMLNIPVRLVRVQPVSVKVLSASGEVRLGPSGPALAAGASLEQGQSVATGAGGSAVLELADGTRVKVQPSSVAEVLASRRLGSTDTSASTTLEGRFDAALRLIQGSIEVFATKVLRARPLEVTTPTAVVGVRGTQFRVGVMDAAPVAGPAPSRSEVLDGAVSAASLTARDSNRAVDVGAGFGVAVDANTRTPSPRPLLPAPDLAGLPLRVPSSTLQWQPADAAHAHRVQVAVDEGFERMVADLLVAAGQPVRIGELADGAWHVRARRVDASGIEGYDAKTLVVVKSLAAPPAPLQPAPGSRQSAGPVRLSWAPAPRAAAYDVQLGTDAQFRELIVNRQGVAGHRFDIESLPPGRYWWRLRSVLVDGDPGPWSEAVEFELRAVPQVARGGLMADGALLRFDWTARAGDLQQVELARDAQFTQFVAQAELMQPQWQLPKPELPGTYYMRHRSIAPDRHVTPWSPPVTVDVPRDWSGVGWLLLPLLLAL